MAELPTAKATPIKLENFTSNILPLVAITITPMNEKATEIKSNLVKICFKKKNDNTTKTMGHV